MEVQDRNDFDHGFLKVTQKIMGNGEVRSRVKYTDGPSVSYTKAVDWNLDDGKIWPWQDTHYHKGLIEVYTLIKGFIVFVYKKDLKKSAVSDLSFNYFHRSGEVLTFNPDVPHVVLLGPNAQILTTLFGSKIGNPDRQNNDWWTVDSVLQERMIDFGNFFAKSDSILNILKKIP